MDPKTHKYLEEAKKLFDSLRLLEAYTVLRRVFDSLPFRVEPAHAEAIAMFARCLTELGKDRELQFYMNKLEQWRVTLKSPEIAYSLGVVYRYLPQPQWEKSFALFDEVLRGEGSKVLKAKAKLMLAGHYSVHGDTASCRLILESVGHTGDVEVDTLTEIWFAQLYRLEKKLDEAKTQIEKTVASLEPERSWYAHFSATILLIAILTDQNEITTAQRILGDLKTRFSQKNYRTVLVQIKDVETLLNRSSEMPIPKENNHEMRPTP